MSESFGFPVLGRIDDWLRFLAMADQFCVAIGNNAVREKLCIQLMNAGRTLTNVIHPKVYVSLSVKLGKGMAVMAGVVVGTEAVLGDGEIVNVNASVDHHCELADYAHIGVGVSLAGGVKVGRSA